MSERLYHGYTLEEIEKMGGDNEACIAYALIAHIRELEADLAAVKRKADAYEELRQCFRGDPRMDGSTAYMVPDMVRANAVLNRHDVARIRAGLQ